MYGFFGHSATAHQWDHSIVCTWLTQALGGQAVHVTCSIGGIGARPMTALTCICSFKTDLIPILVGNNSPWWQLSMRTLWVYQNTAARLNFINHLFHCQFFHSKTFTDILPSSLSILQYLIMKNNSQQEVSSMTHLILIRVNYWFTVFPTS